MNHIWFWSLRAAGEAIHVAAAILDRDVAGAPGDDNHLCRDQQNPVRHRKRFTIGDWPGPDRHIVRRWRRPAVRRLRDPRREDPALLYLSRSGLCRHRRPASQRAACNAGQANTSQSKHLVLMIMGWYGWGCFSTRAGLCHLKSTGWRLPKRLRSIHAIDAASEGTPADRSQAQAPAG